ncbi:hypothetical protein AMJ85_08130 [candidate division BRC1 bacterium SM23_51]|nr:MAG: hypothetical protein AMJ85_08130 [candidate division BRC1 bacterium SM23_51]
MQTAITNEREPWRPDRLSVVNVAGALAAAAVLLVAVSFLAMQWPLLPPVILAGIVIGVWCLQRPSRWLYLIIATIFLESTTFSFYVGGARVRPAQVLLLPALATMALFWAGGSIRARRVPLLVPLLFYLACNFLSALFSASPQQCFKILLLLTSGVLFYVVTYTLVRDDPRAWPSLFRFFVFIGLLQVGYGLYQVMAGYLNVRLGLALPIGHLGLFHAEYVGTIFGRPYGTLVEPDTYGAVCLFYALLLGLMWLTASSRACSWGWVVFLTAGAALGGLLIGFVRASWFGFLAGLVLALYSRASRRMRPIGAIRFAAVGGLIFVVAVSALTTVPQLRALLARRFATRSGGAALSAQNVRFVQMRASYRLFRQRPLLGNGPGSFSVLGIRGSPEDLLLIEMGIELRRIYDPSIVTTVLNDTGLLGTAAFLILAASYFSYVRRRARRMSDAVSRNAAVAGHCAWVGLLASFVFTHYFWMPFTWLFFAMVVLLHEVGLRDPDWWRHGGDRDAGNGRNDESPDGPQQGQTAA